MTATSDNNVESIESTATHHTQGGIDTVNKFKHLVMGQHGNQELQRTWKAVWNNNLEIANKLREKMGEKPYDDSEDAVRALVWKVCWYSHYDMNLIKKALRRSEFEATIDYNPQHLEQMRQDAMEAHDTLYQAE